MREQGEQGEARKPRSVATEKPRFLSRVSQPRRLRSKTRRRKRRRERREGKRRDEANLFWLRERYDYKEEPLNRGPGPLQGTEV